MKSTLSLFNKLLKTPSLLLIVFSAVYVLLSYRGTGLTMIGDYGIPLHPMEYLARLTYSSDPWSGFGSPLHPIFSLPSLPEILFFALMDPITSDLCLANKIYVFFLVAFSSVSMYNLAAAIFRTNRHNQLIGAVAAIVYLFNPLMVADTYEGMIFRVLSLAQIGYILFLTFTIKYFQHGKIKFAIYSGAASFLMLSTPGLRAYLMIFLALLSFSAIALYYLAKLRSKVTIKSIIRGLSVFAILSLILNSYWLISFFEMGGTYASTVAGFQTRTFFNKFSAPINTFRLMNYWGFYSGYTPYADVYITNSLLLAITFVWPIFAFAPLLWKSTIRRPRNLAIYGMTLLTVTAACGSSPPLGHLYDELVQLRVGELFILKPFYTTVAVSYFVLTIEYAVLIALFSSLIYCKLAEHMKNPQHMHLGKIIGTTGVTLVIVVLMISSWPILTGDIMRSWYSPDRYGVQIPDSYWEANDYLGKNSDLSRRTLLLPPMHTYVGTTWGYQGATQFYNRMFNVPLITGNEIPYDVGSNETLISQVHSFYYFMPQTNNALDVIEQVVKVVGWQHDNVALTDELRIDFNNTYLVDKWHAVELRLPYAENWSNLTHMMVELSTELNLGNLQIGVGDTRKNVGWWVSDAHVYKLNNETLLPALTKTKTAQDDRRVILLLNLEKPDRSDYAVSNVASVWIRYYLTNSSLVSDLRVNKINVARLSIDTCYYASFLAQYSIKYVVIDLAVQDGAKDDPHVWLNMLSSSPYFEIAWQKDSLYIFRNLFLGY